jgi:hypothetical protein
MASEQNHINRMQEWLQAHCPVNNCKLLWRDEHEDVGGCFRVRIILVNTGTSSDKDMQMPWSDAFVRRMDAKKDAARLCLQSLLRAQLFPHDPTKVPLAVALIGVGGGGGDEGDRSSAPGPELILPDLAPNNPFGLLSVDPVIMTPVATGGAGQILDDHSEDDEDDKADLRRMTAIKSSSSTAPVSAAPQSLPPANLGKLGEQYALAWLAAQPWVVPGSVRWENTSAQAATRDITCLPKGSPGRAHIEVKTRWRRFRKAGASRAQRERLLDPEDDYMLLILGFFENMYPSDDTPPKPPCIRILPNVKWEDQTVTCVWCDHAFAWSVAEQQASGAVRPNMDKPPELCAPCLSKLKCKRTGGELRKCVSCHKTWVYEVGEQRFLEKKGYSDPKRCKPCRAQAREGKKNATDKTPVEMLILDEEIGEEFMGQVWKEMGKTSEAQVGGPLTRIDAIEQKFTEAADIRRKELTMRRIEQDDLEQW